jgi:hypothetical protein
MLEQGRRQFLALVGPVRPELHRYCARMTGSVADGEVVVQETLARAYYELPQLAAMPALRPWLFRIAHNRAIDHWRHEAYRTREPLDAAVDIADDAAHEPDNVLARHQAVRRHGLPQATALRYLGRRLDCRLWVDRQSWVRRLDVCKAVSERRTKIVQRSLDPKCCSLKPGHGPATHQWCTVVAFKCRSSDSAQKRKRETE